MSINTEEDWWEVAKRIIPLLEIYASKFQVTFNTIAAEAAINKKDHYSLFLLCEELWVKLPDIKDIQTYPFNDLSDLCSEYWVFCKKREH